MSGSFGLLNDFNCANFQQYRQQQSAGHIVSYIWKLTYFTWETSTTKGQ